MHLLSLPGIGGVALGIISQQYILNKYTNNIIDNYYFWLWFYNQHVFYRNNTIVYYTDIKGKGAMTRKG